MIWIFKRPAQMEAKTHKFTDDVAAVRALTKRRAIQKFNTLYNDVKENEVQMLWWGRYNYCVQVLTNY